MNKLAVILCTVLTLGCGWRSPDSFAEKTGEADGGSIDVGVSPDTAADTTASPDVSQPETDVPVTSGSPVFATLDEGSAASAMAATTGPITSDAPVFLWVVTFSSMGAPNPPSVAGFELVEQQIAGNRRQIALLRADRADGDALSIDLGGQPQQTILWVALSATNTGSVAGTSSFQSSGDAASVSIPGADTEAHGLLGGFIVGGNVTTTPDPGFRNTGSACGASACLHTVAGLGPGNSVGASWTGSAPWIGTGAVIDPP